MDFDNSTLSKMYVTDDDPHDRALTAASTLQP